MADIFIQNYDKNMREVLSDIDKASFYENWQENETWEVGFTVSKTEKNAVTYDLIDYESSVIWNGQEFVIKQMTPSASGKRLTKQVVATHVYYTIQDGRQYNVVSGTLSIVQCLNHIFAAGNRGFSYSIDNINGIIGRVEQENFGAGNYLKLIQEILADYNAVVIPDNKHLRFYPREYYGEKTNNVIRYKYNTDGVQFDIDTYGLKTQIRGSGKRKEPLENQEVGDWYFQPITYTSPEASKWGIRIQDPIEDDRYTIASNMIDRLRAELHDYPDITGAVTMKMPVAVGKGDYVRFVYEPLGINTFIQVCGIKTYPLIPNKPPEITLSNTKKTMTKYLAQLAKLRKEQ